MKDLTKDFLDACRGTDPDVTALEWLSALLTDLRDRDYTWCTGDNEAAEAAVVASEALLAALRAAVAQAEEEETRVNAVGAELDSAYREFRQFPATEELVRVESLLRDYRRARQGLTRLQATEETR